MKTHGQLDKPPSVPDCFMETFNVDSIVDTDSETATMQ